jgi:purine-binding chemotaxis protein CheW
MQQLDGLRNKTSAPADTGQFLTFSIGREEYAIDILKVQEIKGYSAITPIPNAPAYVKGVMNLRGTIIPVLDLRTRLGLPTVEYNRFTVIVVVTVGTKVMGLVVDNVTDVLTIPHADIQAPPEFGEAAEGRAIHGLVKTAESVLLLLDIERCLAADAQAVTAKTDGPATTVAVERIGVS